MEFKNNLLKFMVPINQLQLEHQQQMAQQSNIIQLNAGDELSSNEEQRWYLFLLEGKLDMLELDKPPYLLDNQDERARHPLFMEGGRKTHLIAQTQSYIVRFDRRLFNTYLEQELISGEEQDAVEMNEVEAALFNEIMRAYNMGELKLPSLPDIASRMRAALFSSQTLPIDMARIVSADPAIAAKLINAANSLLNRSDERISSVQSALDKLGIQTSKALVKDFTSKQLFDSKSKMLSQRLHELYDTSIDVAAIAYSLSRQSGELCPEHMMLAGLIHEIGIIPILNYIEDTGLIISDEKELERIIQRLKGAVGSMVIRHFGLPMDLLNVVEGFENWQRNVPGDIDACDMIIISQIYHRLRKHQFEGLPPMHQVPAFKKLFPVNQGADFAKNVFHGAHEEIASVMQLLKM